MLKGSEHNTLQDFGKLHYFYSESIKQFSTFEELMESVKNTLFHTKVEQRIEKSA